MLIAAKWGAVVGAGTYLALDVVLTLVALLVSGSAPAGLDTNPTKLMFGCLSIFLLLFAFSAAGYFAGRETRVARWGAVGGMVAFAVYAVLGALYTPGAAAASAATAATTVPKGAPQPSALTQAISQVAATLVVLGLAALMGWLGGRPGAQRALREAARMPAAERAPGV